MQTDWRLNTVVCMDAQEAAAQLANNSIDLIFTDPPYPREYHYLYSWLAETAARILKPGGFLLAYTPVYYKADIMRRFGKHLGYFYDYIAIDASDTSILWPRRTLAKYKSILAYVKGEGMPRCNVLGVWTGGGPDKRYHEWGQDEQTARYYIDCFTRPGDVVFEPFSGGGTTPFVCDALGRNFYAVDQDPMAVTIANARLNGILPSPPLMEDLPLFGGAE